MKSNEYYESLLIKYNILTSYIFPSFNPFKTKHIWRSDARATFYSEYFVQINFWPSYHLSLSARCFRSSFNNEWDAKCINITDAMPFQSEVVKLLTGVKLTQLVLTLCYEELPGESEFYTIRSITWQLIVYLDELAASWMASLYGNLATEIERLDEVKWNRCDLVKWKVQFFEKFEGIQLNRQRSVRDTPSCVSDACRQLEWWICIWTDMYVNARVAFSAATSRFL